MKQLNIFEHLRITDKTVISPPKNFTNDPSFYRTTPMDNDDAVKAEYRAISQEAAILDYLQITGLELTAWQLKNVFPSFEITSIRRGLFNLEMKSCQIEQTGWVKGPKGVNVGKYKAK